MLIKKLQLKNFKRFADLTIDLDPENSGNLPKLVLLIGTNGSGKSSVFDAFENLNTLFKKNLTGSGSGQIREYFLNYLHKNGSLEFGIETTFEDFSYYNFTHSNSDNSIKVDTDLKSLNPNAFYGRTAFRYTPKITKTTIGTTTDTSKDNDRPSQFIEYDIKRFENDLDTFVINQLKAFNEANPSVKAKFNQKFNQAFQNIFGLSENISLKYTNFETPAEGRPFQFFFKKGNSSFNYDLLSAGEKMVFEILFNLYAREDLYQNSIVFLDEIDLHLNTSLQKNLLKEITENWIPDNCQIWVASHSLGFIEYAREYNKGVIIDFDNLDFDFPQVLAPQKNETLDVYEVAVPKNLIFNIFNDKKVILCENKNDEYYNLLGIGETIFFSEKDKNSVIYNSKGNDNLWGLIDRDYLSDEEVLQIKKEHKNLLILNLYSFENYLYHPDNIEELYKQKILMNWDRESYIQKIIKNKNDSKIELGISLDSRKSYVFFKNKNNKEKEGRSEIIQALNSDNFDDFYKYFDIKKHAMPNLNITKKDLVSTAWFKEQIQKVLE